eukprot:g6092.t1
MPVNVKNPAIKRIHADVRELMKDPSDQYHAAPLESNLFEWHFTIRGPPETEFDGGVYHGRIILPPEYPFRPPDIMFMTPNGRFSTGMKICLTISSYHPEHWQPAWGIRLILEALISFFPSPSQGALGGLDWSPEERKRLAAESREWKCYKCGLAIDLLPELRPNGGGGGGGGGPSSNYADQIRELHKLKAKTAAEVAAESPIARSGAAEDPVTASDTTVGGGAAAGTRVSTPEPSSERGEAGSAGSAAAAATTTTTSTTVVAPSSPRLRSVGGAPAEGGGGSTTEPPVDDDDRSCSSAGTGGGVGSGGQPQHQQQQQEEETALAGENRDREDDLLSFFAVAIALAIVGILVRKIYRFVV